MKESDIQKAIMDFLQSHPKVAHCWVTTTGQFRVRGGYIKLGYPGISDIIGQLKDGRFMAMEVKPETGKATKEQLDFLDAVNYFNGVAGIVRSPEDAAQLLQEAL